MQALMDEQLQAILSDIGWNVRDIVITPLMGGITNRNYRVEIGGETFVLRVGGEKTALLGIDRQQEFVCATIAAQLGIGPEIVHFLPEKQAMVSRFLIGETLSATRVAQPERLPRIVQGLRRVPEGP